MEIWQAIILGAVQGFAEFLPISSSGHLILLGRWLGVSGGGLFFDVTLHLGTLIPVVIVFYKQIIGLFKEPYDKLLLIIVASLPACITGIFLGDYVESAFYQGSLFSAVLLALTFLLTSIELYFSQTVSKNTDKKLPLSIKSSAVMGIMQGIAIVPGLSRSGTVLTGGCLTKLSREDNANFTFLMSVPVILGAILISGYKAVTGGENIEIVPILFGVITATLTGYIAIKIMLKVIKNANYKWFSLYLVIMAISSIISKIAFGV